MDKRFCDEFGGYWSEHPDFPVEDWRYLVMNGDTRHGYWEHVQNEIAMAADD